MRQERSEKKITERGYAKQAEARNVKRFTEIKAITPTEKAGRNRGSQGGSRGQLVKLHHHLVACRGIASNFKARCFFTPAGACRMEPDKLVIAPEITEGKATQKLGSRGPDLSHTLSRHPSCFQLDSVCCPKFLAFPKLYCPASS